MTVNPEQAAYPLQKPERSGDSVGVGVGVIDRTLDPLASLYRRSTPQS